MSSILNDTQRWILFYVFIGAFVIITALTIWGVFFGLENLDEGYKNTLFGSLVIEIVSVVIFVFKGGFTGGSHEPIARKIWLDFGEGEDVQKYIGKDVLISPRGEDGNPISEEITNKILNDRGLYVSPTLPVSTVNVFLTLESGNSILEGSVSVQSYAVKLEGEVE